MSIVTFFYAVSTFVAAQVKERKREVMKQSINGLVNPGWLSHDRSLLSVHGPRQDLHGNRPQLASHVGSPSRPGCRECHRLHPSCPTPKRDPRALLPGIAHPNRQHCISHIYIRDVTGTASGAHRLRILGRVFRFPSFVLFPRIRDTIPGFGVLVHVLV